MSMEAQEQSKALEVAQRRELVVQGVEVISEVLGYETSAAQLYAEAYATGADSQSKLIAKRGVRFLEEMGKEGSELAAAIGDSEDGLYHAAEGIVTFGADNKRFLELLTDEALSPAEATSVYALRHILEEETGTQHSINSVLAVMEAAGIHPDEVRQDPYAVAQEFDARNLINVVAKRIPRGESGAPLRSALASGDYLAHIIGKEDIEAPKSVEFPEEAED